MRGLLAFFLAALPAIVLIVCLGVFVSWKIALVLLCIGVALIIVRLIIALIITIKDKGK